MDIGSPETLAGRNKLFVIDPLRWPNHGLYGPAITQPYPLPLPIPGDGTAAVTKLPIGDDLPAAGKSGTLESAELHIHLSNPGAVRAVEVRLNGALLTPMKKDPQTGWLVFQPRAVQYRLGSNELSFRAVSPSTGAKTLPKVIHVEVPVIYR